MHPRPYLVESHAAGVTAWATERLNFEPKDWRADLKAELATATKGLGAREGELLHARYASAVTTACDAENVLIYNVGPGCFAAVARDGLRVERALSLPPNPPKLDGPPLHHHSYGYVPASAGFTHWRRGPTLAAWENVPCSRPTSETKVAEVWHAFRRCELPLTRALSDPSAAFGLSLAVHVPAAAGGFRPASCVKSLFDGTLVAWHAHDGSNGAEVAKRIAAQLRGTDAVEVSELLQDTSRAALGRRQLVWPWGRSGVSVQWSPADERCVAAELLRQSAAGGDWSLSGELFEVIPVA